MKTHTLSALVSLCILGSTFAAQAKVFICSGIVTKVVSKYGNFEVQYKSTRTGNQMEPVWIYDTHTYLLGPVLKAIEEGEKYGTEYALVLENREGGDTRCWDGSSDNALIAISKK
ncbi:hypothetical protein [Pseudoalteromonas luteoviolacea]|nr:hypothetical protein [Pseudoalteromonas luteoviolacea]AOT10296.1 hypothetical protein S4054249_17845 [Pseudoalteromonas luteoviolacea]AOT15211.1 hypothetical protein S40542_17815 [Pseudoalteromonas luteoviolacea]AOT20126.1 hypothetical protein S4054_17820 [Pseudoalteromonas luteoviolacea]